MNELSFLYIEELVILNLGYYRVSKFFFENNNKELGIGKNKIELKRKDNYL